MEALFVNPYFTGITAFLSIFLSVYFYIKQTRAQRTTDIVISRLQTENSKLHEQNLRLKEEYEPDENVPLDPSREQRVIRLRALLQSQDYRIKTGRVSFLTIIGTVVCWILYLIGLYQVADGGWYFLGFVIGSFTALVVAGEIIDRYERRREQARADRIRSAFFAANLNLREIDRLIRWVNERAWAYLDKKWLLESFEYWGSQTAEDWTAKPVTLAPEAKGQPA